MGGPGSGRRPGGGKGKTKAPKKKNRKVIMGKFGPMTRMGKGGKSIKIRVGDKRKTGPRGYAHSKLRPYV